MKAVELRTNKPLVRLVEPNVERDAALGVAWINGPEGYQTLKSMGVPAGYIDKTTLSMERKRVKDFISGSHQLNWMISFEGEVVGAIWVDMEQSGSVKAPAVHLMIGDPKARGQGIGPSAFGAVLEHLKAKGHHKAYTRHTLQNKPVAKLLRKFGFEADGHIYTDEDGLKWQNVSARI